MTSEDVLDAHRETVRAFARPDGPLGQNSPNASIQNPDWFVGGNVQYARPERLDLHERLLQEHRDEHPGVRQDRRAIVLAGPPGAGKSTHLTQRLGLEKSRWLRIDADDFKVKLLEAAQADGSFEGFLKPQAVAEREAAGEKFYPLELASLVHEESSHLAKLARERALLDGTNVVVDSVLSNPQKAEILGWQLEAAGYTVEVLDVEVPFEVSEAGIRSRWRQEYSIAMSGDESLGGRWVPSQYARDVFDPATGRARSQESAERLATTCDSVLTYRRYWREAENAPSNIEVDKVRLNPGGQLMPRHLAEGTGRGAGSSATLPEQRRPDPPRHDPPTQKGPQQ